MLPSPLPSPLPCCFRAGPSRSGQCRRSLAKTPARTLASGTVWGRVTGRIDHTRADRVTLVGREEARQDGSSIGRPVRGSRSDLQDARGESFPGDSCHESCRAGASAAGAGITVGLPCLRLRVRCRLGGLGGCLAVTVSLLTLVPRKALRTNRRHPRLSLPNNCSSRGEGLRVLGARLACLRRPRCLEMCLSALLVRWRLAQWAPRLCPRPPCVTPEEAGVPPPDAPTREINSARYLRGLQLRCYFPG